VKGDIVGLAFSFWGNYPQGSHKGLGG